MNPEEIAWLEEHQRMEVRLGTAKQEEAAWQAHHDRTTQELEAASAAVSVHEAALQAHLEEKPEPTVDDDPDQAEGVDS